MKHSLLLPFAVAAWFSLLNSSESAAIVLDFGLNGQDVQPGYTAVSGPNTVTAAPIQEPGPNGETIIISSSISALAFRDRGNYTTDNYGPEVDLFEDFLRSGTGAANGPHSTMTIDVSGLRSNTPYQFTIHLYDGGMSGLTVGVYEYQITGTGDVNPLNNSYFIEFDTAGQGITPMEQAGYTETLLSDPAGNLQITITQVAGLESSVPLNSFRMDVVPEPGSAVLAIAGALFLTSTRRRRSSQHR